MKLLARFSCCRFGTLWLSHEGKLVSKLLLAIKVSNLYSGLFGQLKIESSRDATWLPEIFKTLSDAAVQRGSR